MDNWIWALELSTEAQGKKIQILESPLCKQSLKLGTCEITREIV